MKEEISEVIDVYDAAFKAAINCPVSNAAKLIGITSIMVRFTSDIDETCLSLVKSKEDPMVVLDKINKTLKRVIDFYEGQTRTAQSDEVLISVLTCSLLAVRSLLKDSKEKCVLLYCTLPIRVVKLQKSLASFESIYNAMPETLKRFTEFGTQEDAQGFINALKIDVTEMYDSGDVDDSTGYRRLMGVLNAQNN